MSLLLVQHFPGTCVAEQQPTLFRQEALEHFTAFQAEGTVIRIAPSWTRYSFWILVWAVAAGFMYSTLGTVHEYASGPAVIRIDGRTDLTAHARGTVAEVRVRPGERVRRGDELIRFYVAEEEAELQRVEKARRELLLRTLIDPADESAKNELAALHAQRELALAHVAQRTISAPHDGVVSDVRARVGQAVDAGDGLITLTGRAASGRVLALVPAQYRPMLRTGMDVRLELKGFRFAYQNLSVETVGDEAVGPQEVKRFLGPDNADTLAVDGPVVIVQLGLTAHDFEAAGETYQYYDGMLGTADVKVRTEPIIVALIPGLKDLIPGLKSLLRR